MVVVTVNVNHRSSPLIGGGGTSPVIYTGYIVSCEKMCSGVNWFRTSTRCVYVYEWWLVKRIKTCLSVPFRWGVASFEVYGVDHVTRQKNGFFQVDTACVCTCIPS